MKKTRRFLSWSKNPPTLKILRIMRLTMIILFSTAMLVSAGTYSQNTKLTLDFTDISYGDLFSKIEAQSEFSFAYNGSNFDPNQKIRVNIANGTIKEILDEILPGNVSYEIINKYVIIRNADESNSSVTQQSLTITGSVTDASGAPLPGVTVIIKGKTTGTITDANGKYSLANVPGDATLAFSFVGMKPQEIKVSGKSTINIAMAEETTAIDEVVAIGYGTVKKKDLSGAVGVVNTKQLDASVNTNLGNALQGKIAGVSVSANGGAPGSGPIIQIRGAGSFGSSDPLVLIDDVPGDMNLLNPNDVESIQVLKDASSAAIYGARAANGVIIITTKSGKAGAIKIDASADYGVQSVKEMKMTNADEWLTVIKQMYTNDNMSLTSMPDIAQHPQVTGKGTDWQNEIYRVAPVQNYYVGASGGGENLRYNASIGYLTQDGVVKTSGYDRLNLRFKSDFTKGRFKIGESVILTQTTTKPTIGWPLGSVQSTAVTSIPVFTPYDSAGQYTKTSQSLIGSVPNPVAAINLGTVNQYNVNILASIYGEVKLMEGLKFKSIVEGSPNIVNRETRMQKFDLGLQLKQDYNYDRQFNNIDKFWQVENTLSYEKTIGKHSINAFIGQSASKHNNSNSEAYKQGLPDGIWAYNSTSNTDGMTVTGSFQENTLASYFGRAIYSYDNRYSITALARRDGSSRFGKLNPWGNFGSVSAYWNIANEQFFKNLGTPVTELKLRGSWGVNGNQEIGDYKYISSISSGNAYNYGSDNALLLGTIQPGMVSQNLKWESTAQTNEGLDVGLWNGKVNYTLDIYQKTTTGILMEAQPALSGGITNNPTVNAGNISNKGFEMALSWNDHKGDFKYAVTATLAHDKNQIISLTKGAESLTGGSGGGTTLSYPKIGYELYSFWLVKTDGLFRSQSEIDNYTWTNPATGAVNKIQPGAKVGDQKYVDANNDGQISEGNVLDGTGDRQYCGSGFPKYEYGLRLDGSWKFIDVSLYLQGVSGNKIYNMWRFGTSSYNAKAAVNFSRELLDSYSFNPNSDVPRLGVNDNNRSWDPFSERWLEDGSYLRLRTAQIGFTLPDNLLRKLSVTRCRIYFAGDNLVTFTRYKGFNPDIGGTNGDEGKKNYGIDNMGYPLAKVYHVGVQLNF